MIRGVRNFLGIFGCYLGKLTLLDVTVDKIRAISYIYEYFLSLDLGFLSSNLHYPLNVLKFSFRPGYSILFRAGCCVLLQCVSLKSSPQGKNSRIIFISSQSNPNHLASFPTSINL